MVRQEKEGKNPREVSTVRSQFVRSSFAVPSLVGSGYGEGKCFTYVGKQRVCGGGVEGNGVLELFRLGGLRELPLVANVNIRD